MSKTKTFESGDLSVDFKNRASENACVNGENVRVNGENEYFDE